MLDAQTALGIVEQIEAIRMAASDNENAVFSDLRSQPDYEANQDRDILEALRLRSEARALAQDADTIISSFDFAFGEDGETVRKRGD